MKHTSIGLFFATLIATTPILATSSFAQNIDMNMVESEVSSDLGKMGISGVDVKMLTLQQLQEIKLVESQNGTDAEKKLKVEKIIGPSADMN